MNLKLSHNISSVSFTISSKQSAQGDSQIQQDTENRH